MPAPQTTSLTEGGISVLVPVLNEGAGIREAVEAMQAQRFPSGEVEFLFADGRSTDDTRRQLEELAREDRRIRIFDNPAGGTASGLNVCLREARGQYVARMDAHTLYPSDYLRLGVGRLGGGDVAWVAGPQLPEGRGLVGRAVTAALQTRLGQGGSRKWSARPVDGVAAEHDLDTGVFCGVWRRADLLAHGGFDEDWPRNQDSELAARFLRSGQRIVSLPTMAASYQPRDSLAGLWRQYRGYGMYRAKTAGRHPTSLRRSAVLPPLVVLNLLATLAPWRPIRRVARLGLALYASSLGAGAIQLALRRRPAEAAVLPVVLPAMHLAHGVGFIEGSGRWGVPWAALLRVAGVRRDGRDEEPYTGSVRAPNLASSAQEA